MTNPIAQPKTDHSRVADPQHRIELLVVGAGPTGIAIGAEARKRGVEVLLVDQGPPLASLLEFPTHMQFFTTTDLLEIADVPFSIPEAKPNRRQALTYYHSVIRRHQLQVLSHCRVVSIQLQDQNGVPGRFAVQVDRRNGRGEIRAGSVAVAMGYFEFPRRLGVEGDDLAWVRYRYHEPYPHFGEDVVVVGGGNSAAEVALDLWRNGAGVTLVHRGDELRPSVKYWLKPDFENRVAEGAIDARYRSRVQAFRGDGEVEIIADGKTESIHADAAYVLIGYRPDMSLFRQAGVEVDEETLVPAFDPATCESNVEGLYIAGSLQAGLDTDQIFIENSRAHAVLIADHVAAGSLPE